MIFGLRLNFVFCLVPKIGFLLIYLVSSFSLVVAAANVEDSCKKSLSENSRTLKNAKVADKKIGGKLEVRGKGPVTRSERSDIEQKVFVTQIGRQGFTSIKDLVVPANAESMQIEVWELGGLALNPFERANGKPAENYFVISDLYQEAPNGTKTNVLISNVVPEEASKQQILAANQFSGGAEGPYLSVNPCIGCMAGYGSVFVPNFDPAVPQARFTGGNWKMRIRGLPEATEGTAVEVRVTYKLESLKKGTYTLPINFYFSGARGWNQNNFRTNPEFVSFWERMSYIFGQGEIKLQLGVAVDLPRENHDFGDYVLRDFNTFWKLLHQGQAETGINVFLLSSIPGFEGVAAGISGPLLGPKNKIGGLAISLGDANDVVHLGDVTSHEIGHYLGLWHVKENGLDLPDPIEDTVYGSDPVNVMAATGSRDSTFPTGFSNGQFRIIKLNPNLISKFSK